MDEIDNIADPAADERFPNIVPFDPTLDEFGEDDEFPCATMTIEEVHPDG